MIVNNPPSIQKVRNILLIIILVIISGHQANGQIDSVFNKQYKSYGISVTVPENYHAGETSIIWKANRKYQHHFSGMIINVCAESPDENCIILYPTFVVKLLQDGKEDRLDGQMALINRELMEGLDVLSESGMTTIRNAKTSELYYMEDHITKITGESVRRMTGADMVCYYDIPINNSEFISNKPSAIDSFNPSMLTRIHILKEGGSHYDVIMLLNESGIALKGYYIQQVLANIHFDKKRIQETWEVIGTNQ